MHIIFEVAPEEIIRDLCTVNVVAWTIHAGRALKIDSTGCGFRYIVQDVQDEIQALAC
jgi:hypothetical protein